MNKLASIFIVLASGCCLATGISYAQESSLNQYELIVDAGTHSNTNTLLATKSVELVNITNGSVIPNIPGYGDLPLGKPVDITAPIELGDFIQFQPTDSRAVLIVEDKDNNVCRVTIQTSGTHINARTEQNKTCQRLVSSVSTANQPDDVKLFLN